MISIQHLSYRYPGAERPVLRDVSLEVQAGDLVLLTGPSGSGKSTLLRCLNGLVPHFTGGQVRGSLCVAGVDPVAAGPSVMSAYVGLVAQDPEGQFVVDRVEEEIAFAMEQRGVAREEMYRRVDEALSRMGMLHLRHRALHTLSGGERQRVAIAAALVLEPRILVLDEPTSQLDPSSADDVLRAVVNLNQETGLTVLLAEHRLERVVPYVHRVVHVSESGGVIVSGPARRMLGEMDEAPPLIRLGRELGWHPLPLTVEEARANAASLAQGVGVRVDIPDGIGPKLEGPILEVQDVHFSYGNSPVLGGVSFQMAPGELVALLGRNGSGKTTLLKCLAGLVQAERGDILLGGESLIGRPVHDICRRIGYLPQEPDDLLFADTVRGELDVTLRNHGLLSGPPIAPEVLLRRLGLESVAGVYPRDLSVGQRQRVSLGAVTVTRPPLILLDEPTRGLDYGAKRDLAHLLSEWQSEGTAILLVSHDVELVAEAADRVMILDGGTVVADGAPSEVLEHHPVYAPQIARLFPGSGWLTPEHVLGCLAVKRGDERRYAEPECAGHRGA